MISFLTLHISIYRSIYLSIAPSTYLYIYSSIYLCLYLSIDLSTYLSIYSSIYLSLYLSIALSTYLSIYSSIYPSIALSIYLQLYLSIYSSIYLSLYLYISLSTYLSMISICISVYLVHHLEVQLRQAQQVQVTSLRQILVLAHNRRRRQFLLENFSQVDNLLGFVIRQITLFTVLSLFPSLLKEREKERGQ